MEYTKEPLDYSLLITLLRTRGLLFRDETTAIKTLHSINYFHLASYLRPMEIDKTTHLFKPHSYFENAVSLWHFDKCLRALLFTTIQSIEIALRTKMIHHISLRYGAFWFMREDLMTDKSTYENILSHIQKEVQRTKEDFIVDYFDMYSTPPYPPIWKTFEVISFGTVSKLLCNFADNTIKKQIALEFNLKQHLYLENWLKCIVVLRNYVAHHYRLWNRMFPFRPQLPAKMPNAWIDVQQVNHSKIYAQLCCIAYLLDSIGESRSFKQPLKQLIASYPNVDIKAMGFPSDWQSEPLWNM